MQKKDLKYFFTGIIFGKNEIFRTVSHFIMYPAPRVKEYIYLIKRKRHKTETRFNLAIIGCEMHVKMSQKLANSTEEP